MWPNLLLHNVQKNLSYHGWEEAWEGKGLLFSLPCPGLEGFWISTVNYIVIFSSSLSAFFSREISRCVWWGRVQRVSLLPAQLLPSEEDTWALLWQEQPQRSLLIQGKKSSAAAWVLLITLRALGEYAQGCSIMSFSAQLINILNLVNIPFIV